MLISFLCFNSVNSQSSSTSTPSSGSAPSSTSAHPRPSQDPNSIWSKIKQFHEDAHAMKTSGTVDSTKLMADLQAIVTAAKAKSITIPPSVQTKIDELQTTIQQSPARANTQETLNKMIEVKREIAQVVKASQKSAPTTVKP